MSLSIKAAKKGFFDKKAVIDALGKARAMALGRKGALVRKIAKNSMKTKPGPAKPDSPPNAHVGNLKKYMYFAFDRGSNSVVVGPAKLGSSADPVPGKLEKGGTVLVRGIRDRRGIFVPLRKLPRPVRVKVIQAGKIVVANARLEARPYMVPALKKSAPMLARQWKGTFKR